MKISAVAAVVEAEIVAKTMNHVLAAGKETANVVEKKFLVVVKMMVVIVNNFPPNIANIGTCHLK